MAFVDATAASKLGFVFNAARTPARYLIEAMGGGVAMLDADGDGLPGIFFVNGAGLKNGMTSSSRADKSDPEFWNRLYRNKGDGTFTDVTEKAGVRGSGYGQGAAVGDCDNDGLPDLFVSALDGNTLYRNQGGGVFEDITGVAGVTGGGWSTECPGAECGIRAQGEREAAIAAFDKAVTLAPGETLFRQNLDAASLTVGVR